MPALLAVCMARPAKPESESTTQRATEARRKTCVQREHDVSCVGRRIGPQLGAQLGAKVGPAVHRTKSVSQPVNASLGKGQGIFSPEFDVGAEDVGHSNDAEVRRLGRNNHLLGLHAGERVQHILRWIETGVTAGRKQKRFQTLGTAWQRMAASWAMRANSQ